MVRFGSVAQVWNNNYNIKPREIAQAQEALTDVFQATFQAEPKQRDMVRLFMGTVGRGGQGNGGQRIRDEILDVQVRASRLSRTTAMQKLRIVIFRVLHGAAETGP